MIQHILLIFNSRKTAAWLLIIMVLALMLSTLLPVRSGTTDQEWLRLSQQQPLVCWLSTRFSTPDLVTSPLFIILTLILCMSTLVCTCMRLNGWWRNKTSEFSTDKAFSFSIEGKAVHTPQDGQQSLIALLRQSGWEINPHPEDGMAVKAQRGLKLSFWGSIIFHVGLLCCFIALPVTALSKFSGSLLLTEGVMLPLRTAVTLSGSADAATLPDLKVRVEELRAVYADSRYKLDFGGTMVVRKTTGEEKLPFAVNNPVTVDGLQFSLQKIGFSPQVIITKGETVLFDYYANLRHSEEGDYFPLAGSDDRLLLVLLPDFIQRGDQVGSMSREPKNPKLLYKIVRGETTLHKGMLGLGEVVNIDDFQVRFPELKYWADFSLSREKGLGIMTAGFAIGIFGLLVRFLSNERCIEVEWFTAENGTNLRLRGYSRYYPAFLEREVRQFGDTLIDRGDMD